MSGRSRDESNVTLPTPKILADTLDLWIVELVRGLRFDVATV
jgi:hypothetical protein